MTSASSTASWRAHATHLVVFQHGLWGNEKDFRNFETLFQQYFPQDEVFTHIATSNATSLSSIFQTYDGIDTGGTRLADEVEAVAKAMPRLAKLSMIGHSLGGLYARYCVGVLYARGFFEDVEPMNFVTLATPHLGIRRSQPTPLNAMFNTILPNLFDLTGQQFSLKDKASQQAIALSHSVSRYPHRRPNVVYGEMDEALLVQLPHDRNVDVHPATTTLAEAKSFEITECMLREGILYMYRKRYSLPVETDETLTRPHMDDHVSISPSTDDEADSEDDEIENGSEDSTKPRTYTDVTRIAEIDLQHANVTVVVPEKGGQQRPRRRHKLSRRASSMSQNVDGAFWDIEIAVDIPVQKGVEEIMGKAAYTIRIPYDELASKWKWIAALSNASHGVHCRSQTSPTTTKDNLMNSSAPTVLSCLTRGQFIQALQLFRSRALYSSIFNDMSVPYSCGAIRAFNPYRTELDPSEASRSPYYHHIVMRSLWNAPLLRDTLPEEIKNRAERASSVDRFSLVKMLSERTTSRSRFASVSRESSFSSLFFSNITSSQTSRGRAASSASSVSSAAPAMHERLEAITPAVPHSDAGNSVAERETDSDSSGTGEVSTREGKRMPPFEDGSLLLDHADQSFSNDVLRDSLRGMMLSLQSVGWRRIDVLFHSPLAHMKIIAMTANPTKPITKGLDVVHHVMDTFLL